MASKIYYFACVGLPEDNQAFAGSNMVLQKVNSARKFPDCMAKTTNRFLMAALALWSPAIEYELAIRIQESDEPRKQITSVIFIIATLIRCRTRAEFVLPMYSENSWTSIHNDPNLQSTIYLVEQENSFHAQRLKRKPQKIHPEQIAWVEQNLTTHLGDIAPNIEDRERLLLAMDCLNSFHLERMLILRAFKLYIGLEALFGFGRGAFSLACAAAAYLEPRGHKRKIVFEKILGHSSLRNDIAHGKRYPERERLRIMQLELRSYLADSISQIFLDRAMPRSNLLVESLLKG